MANTFDSNILEKLNKESNIRVRKLTALNNVINVEQVFNNELKVNISDNFLNSDLSKMIPINQQQHIKTETNATKNIYNLNITPIIQNMFTDFSEEAILKLEDVLKVKGKSTQSFVFDTLTDIEEQLNNFNFKQQLNEGDLFFLTNHNEPDYWWDGTQLRTYEIEYNFQVSTTAPTVNDEKTITFII